jgi:hypothetical protein
MSNDGKQILENLIPENPIPEKSVIREVIKDAFKEAASASEPKAPEGCTERTVTMRDRNSIMGACQAYCQKDGHKGLLDQTRLNRIKKILNWDETLEYFAMIDDSLDDEIRIWKRAKNQHKLWKDYRAGLIKAEDVKKTYPDLDLEGEFKKPPLREPELKPEDKCGPKKVVYLPSKLDAWVQDALKAMEWLPKMEELAVEVCAKFGIKSEE